MEDKLQQLPFCVATLRFTQKSNVSMVGCFSAECTTVYYIDFSRRNKKASHFCEAL
jgi:hypothetical protein